MDESTHNQCLFSEVLDSCSIEKTYAASALSSVRKQTVIKASHQREDSLHETINDGDLIYHTLCYSAYTSKEKIQLFICGDNCSVKIDETHPDR